MAGEATTRQSTVEANITTATNKYGTEAWAEMMIALLKDIDVSLAMIADNTTPST